MPDSVIITIAVIRTVSQGPGVTRPTQPSDGNYAMWDSHRLLVKVWTIVFGCILIHVISLYCYMYIPFLFIRTVALWHVLKICACVLTSLPGWRETEYSVSDLRIWYYTLFDREVTIRIVLLNNVYVCINRSRWIDHEGTKQRRWNHLYLQLFTDIGL